jgi:hypothetical protein
LETRTLLTRPDSRYRALKSCHEISRPPAEVDKPYTNERMNAFVNRNASSARRLLLLLLGGVCCWPPSASAWGRAWGSVRGGWGARGHAPRTARRLLLLLLLCVVVASGLCCHAGEGGPGELLKLARRQGAFQLPADHTQHRQRPRRRRAPRPDHLGCQRPVRRPRPRHRRKPPCRRVRRHRRPTHPPRTQHRHRRRRGRRAERHPYLVTSAKWPRRRRRHRRRRPCGRSSTCGRTRTCGRRTQWQAVRGSLSLSLSHTHTQSYLPE